MSRLTVASTTAAKAVAMMNATASSTRLPRSRKFLNPVMAGRLVGQGEGEISPRRCVGERRDVAGVGPHDHEPAAETSGPGRGGLRGRGGDRQHRGAGGDHA